MSKIKKEYYNFNVSELIDLLSNLQIKETKFLKSSYTKELKNVLADMDLIFRDKKIIKKGSTVFLHSNVVHGSVPNDSQIYRNAVLFTNIRDGLNFIEGRESKIVKTKLK